MTTAAQGERLTEDEARFERSIGEAVDRRAQAAREEREATREIAALCVEARAAGVPMARLAQFVQVLAPDDDGEGRPKLRSVTRQAVDQLVAHFEGRQRAPRKRHREADENGRPRGAIKLGAFE